MVIIYLAGRSDTSWGTPIAPHVGDWDAFAAKLNSSGTLQWHNFLGSSVDDYSNGIAVDGSGNVFVAGGSDATWGSPIVAYAGGGDAFVGKLNGSGVLQWHTFLGGPGDDWGSSIALDGSNNIYAAGESDTTWGSPVAAHVGGWGCLCGQAE